MLDLTFGEQVKIILSRRGMTIKELAETIEKHTGKKMSRQNLTQRLGRDNFQEQDMRMIAEILDCTFQLSILGEDGVPTEKEEQEHYYIQQEYVQQESREETQSPKREAPERDITIGELVDIHEELDAMIGQEQEELPPSEDPVAELLQEIAEEEREREETQEEPQNDKTEKRHSWRDYLLHRIWKPEERTPEEKMTEGAGSGRREAEIRSPEPVAESVTEEYMLEKEEPLIIEEEPAKMTAEEAARAELEEFTAEEEDLDKGDVNPYTGREYKSNSVRMHPTRIGYVQVYDRGTHTWTDMTEWAFLGYQERKKALLGKDYVPPIYLD